MAVKLDLADPVGTAYISDGRGSDDQPAHQGRSRLPRDSACEMRMFVLPWGPSQPTLTQAVEAIKAWRVSP